MMQLAIVLFLMLLCGTFGKVVVNNDLNAITTYDKKILINNDKLLLSNCVFGVKSVSVLMFTSNSSESQGEFVDINKTCNRITTSKVIFLSHGFLSNATYYNFSDLAAELVQRDYTVYSIDWSDAACFNQPVLIGLSEYPWAASNTREVGNRLASMAKSLIDVCKIPLSNITFMGHSLGAHVVGFACKNLKNTGYGKCSRIIASDPAASLFTCKETRDRLDILDAIHIVVFHTSLLGMQVSTGHCDFWFNNGVGQPACGNDVSVLDDSNLPCSHNIAIVYLIITLNCEFDGVPIQSRKNCWIPNFVPGCPSSTTNSINVNKTILDSNYNGNYCVPVNVNYPYGAKNCKK